MRSFRFLLHLKALQSLLMGPGLDGEIGLGIETDAENDNSQEAGYVARQLPVFPLPRLPRWRWCPVEEVAVWLLLVTWARPSAWTRVGRPESSEEAMAECAAERHRVLLR